MGDRSVSSPPGIHWAAYSDSALLQSIKTIADELQSRAASKSGRRWAVVGRHHRHPCGQRLQQCPVKETSLAPQMRRRWQSQYRSGTESLDDMPSNLPVNLDGEESLLDEFLGQSPDGVDQLVGQQQASAMGPFVWTSLR